MLTAGLALHTDKYQINMMYAHWINGSHRTRAVFEAYFRKLPFGNGYAVLPVLSGLCIILNPCVSRMRISRIWPNRKRSINLNFSKSFADSVFKGIFIP